MSLNKYGCHIANISHTVIIINEHIGPTLCIHVLNHNWLQLFSLLCMCQRLIWTSNATYICNMCKLVHVQTWENYINIYASYELTVTNSVTRSVGIHISTLLIYAPKQIFLPHCIYMFHFPTVFHIQTPHHTCISKNRRLQHLFTVLLLYMSEQQICSSNIIYMPHMQNT